MRKQSPKKFQKKAPEKPQDPVRLNKFIANAGICSRREADKLIEQGKIKVNGKVVTTLGVKVGPKDKVLFQGKPLTPEKPIYVLLNKPKDFITTTDDPQGRRTVMELVKTAGHQRIYPVGRLDRMTTGLLLLTNDGDLAKKLSHPSGEVKKLYEVVLDKPITDDDYLKVEDGIKLEDGIAKPDEIAIVSQDRKHLGIQIHIGWNRVIRRIFESIGYEVTKLDRVMYANLTKHDLPRGKWRYLSEKEVIKLKYLNF
ncbi:MAG: pseudouridine synthase [Cyclobacteriaceae bacterium]